MSQVEDKLSFNDMMSNVNMDMRRDITDTLLSTTPLQAMCTLASCLGVISVMASDGDADMAIHNIKEIASFAEAVAKAVALKAADKEHKSAQLKH